ncbi:MAG: HU family DNA-binding protein [Bacteroidaceae bacterium]|nr:HU family DNA-binding protein [Bacteroidaceae bacterium]
MERLHIRELSRQLAQAQNMSIADAEKFVTQMFGVIKEGLEEDKVVFVDSFGSFRSVLSQGRTTVEFTPVESLAERINAPFAIFKTEEVTADVADDEIETDPEEEKAEELPAADAAETETAEEDVEEKVEALSEKLDALTETIERKRRFSKKLWISLLVVAVIIASAFVGYNKMETKRIQEEQQKKKAVRAQQLKHRQDSINAVKLNMDATDLTDQQKQEIVGKGSEGAPDYPCSTTLENAKSLLPCAGYTIDGTMKVVVVQKGQTLFDIASENGLAQGEFLVQVHNGIESVREGQNIRIPRLRKK